VSNSEYQIVAATPGRDTAEVERIAEQVSRQFGVDLSGLLDALSDTGVCVGFGTSIEEARQLGNNIVECGGDYRILDEEGNELETLEAPVEPSAPRSRFSRTIAFGAVDIAKQQQQLELEQAGFAGKDSTIGDGAVDVSAPKKDIELEEAGGYASKDSTITEGAVDVAPDDAGRGERKSIELEETGGFAGANATIGDGALPVKEPEGDVQLMHDSGGFASENATVAKNGLDVTTRAKPMALDEPGGFASENSTIAEGAVGIDDLNQSDKADSLGLAQTRAAGFDGLDGLDEQSLVLLDGTSEEVHEQATVRAEAADFIPPMLAGDDSLELDAPTPPPVDEPIEPDAPLDLATDTTSSHLDDSAPLPPFVEELAPELRSETEQAPVDQQRPPAWGEQAPGPVADDVSPTEPPREHPAASLESRLRRATARKGTAVAAGDVPSGPRIMSGKLHSYPRVRVAIGFLLTLFVSSFIPMCHARNVRADRIEPLRVDLATAKAHGATMAGTPGYRSPDVIEGEIKSLRSRHTVYTIVMWMAMMGLLLFLWFRFT
jgi:hypothetical protein